MNIEIIKVAIKDLEDIAAKTTSGNVSHQMAQIRGVTTLLKLVVDEEEAKIAG